MYTSPPTTEADLKLRVHSYEFLTFDKTIDVPAFPASNGGCLMTGRRDRRR